MFILKPNLVASRLIFTIGILCLTFSCHQTKNTDFKNVARIPVKVDLDDTTAKYAPKTLSSIDYIPLETTKECQFAQVSKLELLDKYFVIFDKGTNAIYFFLKDGKYSHKISNRGLDPEKSYKDISKFFIDRANQRVVIRDNKLHKLIYYDYNGKKVNEKRWPFELKDFNSSGQSQFFYMAYTPRVDSSYLINKDHFFKNLMIGDTTFKIEKSYFKYHPETTSPMNLYNVDNVFYTAGSSILFCDPYQYNIYKFTGEKLDNIFDVSFGDDNKLPENFLISGSKREFITEHPKQIWTITEVYMPTKDLLVFNLRSFKKPHNIFVYSLKTHSYFRLENVYSSDKFNYSLPLYGYGIDAADNNSVYSNIPSLLMYKAVNLVGKSKRINDNPVLKKFFDESTNLSNPVITRLSFKPF